jgi:hypothetical protein
MAIKQEFLYTVKKKKKLTQDSWCSHETRSVDWMLTISDGQDARGLMIQYVAPLSEFGIGPSQPSGQPCFVLDVRV